MRNQQVPNHRLKSFGVRRAVSGIDRWNHNANIRNFRSVSAVAPDDPEYFCAGCSCILQSSHQIWADIFFQIPATDREHEDQIVRSQTADSQPAFKHRGPAFIVGSSREFRYVVGRSVGLDASDLAEIID